MKPIHPKGVDTHSQEVTQYVGHLPLVGLGDKQLVESGEFSAPHLGVEDYDGGIRV